jgi:hypothetical protein
MVEEGRGREGERGGEGEGEGRGRGMCSPKKNLRITPDSKYWTNIGQLFFATRE